jgi:hypothetical protein
MQPNDQPPNTTTTTALSTLAQALFDELTATVRGEVYRRGGPKYVTTSLPLVIVVLISSGSFQEHTRLFNGNVLNTSKAVVLPLDAQDVSQYVALLPCNIIPPDIFAE